MQPGASQVFFDTPLANSTRNFDTRIGLTEVVG
jgi:hypothetical protein